MPAQGVAAFQKKPAAIKIGFCRRALQGLGTAPYCGCESYVSSNPSPFRIAALGLASQPFRAVKAFRLRPLQAEIAGAIGEGVAREGMD